VVVRSISGHLTEQMQQLSSTARGHEQESAIARIIDLTRVQRRVQISSTVGRVTSTVPSGHRRTFPLPSGSPWNAISDAPFAVGMPAGGAPEEGRTAACRKASPFPARGGP